MAIQNDNTLVTKGDLKDLYSNKIAPYLGANLQLGTNISDFYSGHEKIVGVWVDGKPLYQLTLNLGSCAAKTWTEHSISQITDCDMIMKFAVVGKHTSGSRWISEYIKAGAEDYFSLWVRKEVDSSSPTWMCYTHMALSDIYATFQYTKTTDTSSSALITPGCYDLNYPNTWPENKEIYFGNGVYGFRIVMSNITFSGYYSTIPAVNGPDHNCKMISSGGYARTNNNGSDHVIVCYFNANDTLGLKGNWTSSSITQPKIDVWVTYTK